MGRPPVSEAVPAARGAAQVRPGEFSRHLDEQRDRAARNGRQWWHQRHVDIGMSGADEVDSNLTRMYVDPPRQRDPYAPCGP